MYLLEKFISIIKGFAVFTLLVFQNQSPIPPGNTPLTDLNSTTSSAEPTSTTPSANPVRQATQRIIPPSPPITQPNYQIEPHPSGETGFYVLKNTPDEPMATESEVNLAVNQYRLAHNLNPLSIETPLCEIARLRAQEASLNFSHEEFQTHIENGDFNLVSFQEIGENLWQGSFSGVHIVEFGWDKSPGHRANLQANWTQGCAGIFDTTVAFIFAR